MSIRTTNFDALAASSPLDRQASVVRDGGGDHWEAHIPADVKRWLAPPPMTPMASLSGKARSDYQRLIGLRAGRMTVLGIWSDGNPKKNATWVCRCDCGYYEGRKARALLGEHASKLMCVACDRVEVLRKRAAGISTPATRQGAASRLDALANQSRGDHA